MNLEKHKYYGGLTRKGMSLGVPSDLIGVLIMLAMTGYIITKSFHCFVIPVPFWIVAFFICLKDPDYLGVLLVRFTVMPITNRNKKFWSGRSYIP